MITDRLDKLTPTGRTFPFFEGYLASKNGLLCLGCGINCGVLVCDTCSILDRCNLCSIVEKKTDLYKVYTYIRAKTIYKEYYREVVPFCKTLVGGLCETCVEWEKLMKHRCFLCKKEFENSYDNWRDNGNCCQKCNSDINNKTKIIDKSGNPKNPTFQHFKNAVSVCLNCKRDYRDKRKSYKMESSSKFCSRECFVQYKHRKDDENWNLYG